MLGRAAVVAPVVLASITGCQRSRLHTPEVVTVPPEYVRVSKVEPPEACTYVEMVKGPLENNYLALRQRAGNKGANYVVLDAVEVSRGGMGFNWYRTRTVMVGRAFYCDASVDLTGESPRSAEPPPSAKPADDVYLGD
jgi:hypothetical protein